MLGAGLQQRRPGMAAQRGESGAAARALVVATQLAPGAVCAAEGQPGGRVEPVLGAAGGFEGRFQQGDALGEMAGAGRGKGWSWASMQWPDPRQ